KGGGGGREVRRQGRVGGRSHAAGAVPEHQEQQHRRISRSVDRGDSRSAAIQIRQSDLPVRRREEIGSQHKLRSWPGLSPQVGFPRLAALYSAELGQARLPMPSTSSSEAPKTWMPATSGGMKEQRRGGVTPLAR